MVTYIRKLTSANTMTQAITPQIKVSTSQHHTTTELCTVRRLTLVFFIVIDSA